MLAPLRALRLCALSRCRVYAAPVAGSAFVEGAAGCTLHVAARQARSHKRPKWVPPRPTGPT